MRLFVFVFLFSSAAFGGIADGVLCTRDEPCNSRGIYTNKSAGPSKGDAVKINPAAVPVEKVTGIETIYYKNGFDFALVKGLGRVGAAISPSNSDETFFGAPAPEGVDEFYYRMSTRERYQGGKYALAAAANLLTGNGSGLGHYNLNLGLLARYEVATQHVKPGAGLQFILGPVYVSGAAYQDESQVVPSAGQQSLTLSTNVTSYSAGISLDSILLDYSVLRVSSDLGFDSTASVASITGFVGRFILSAAYRRVVSNKEAYDFSNDTLYYPNSTSELFGGVQFKLASFLVIGAYYNYYLLHEGSTGLTIFF